jgi:hypothetical protein
MNPARIRGPGGVQVDEQLPALTNGWSRVTDAVIAADSTPRER